MRLGYFMMPLHPPGSDLARDPRARPPPGRAAGPARLRRGLDRRALHRRVGEHPGPGPVHRRRAPAHRAIVFGTGVSCMPNHSPFVLAHRIAQLDQMARGRFMWGVGAGSFIGDMEMVGIDRESGYQRKLTGDAIDLVLKLWDRARARPLRAAQLALQRPGARPDDRQARPRPAVPEAAPAHRRGRRLRALRDARRWPASAAGSR